jgi:predicted dehydrogenase
MTPVRAAVVGVGSFGRNHARVISELKGVELAAIVDSDPTRAAAVAQEYGAEAYTDIGALLGNVDAAIVATPTDTHESIALWLLGAGIDVLVEKPIAATAAAGERMTRAAEENGQILQVGHLERFNPAVSALKSTVTIPLFFEVHRLSVFSPRSLDVDVVLDLMIHDLDIVLNLTGALPNAIHAAGISVLSNKVDIANVRLEFASGCIANLTASRVSTEQVRKLRLFQPGEYISLDYKRQDANRLAVRNSRIGAGSEQQATTTPQIGFQSLPVEKAEPLQLELRAFFHSVRTRARPVVDGRQAVDALRLAELILDKIRLHADVVAETIRRSGQPSPF